MVTRASARKIATRAAILKFNPEWIKDPPPPFFKNLDRATIRLLNQAKRDLAARVKEILAQGQR